MRGISFELKETTLHGHRVAMGAFASGVRDFAVALGIEAATVVGHSLGGGVAMQFSYQFPERHSAAAADRVGTSRSGDPRRTRTARP